MNVPQFKNVNIYHYSYQKTFINLRKHYFNLAGSLSNKKKVAGSINLLRMLNVSIVK